jgi:hypothetical protein
MSETTKKKKKGGWGCFWKRVDPQQSSDTMERDGERERERERER